MSWVEHPLILTGDKVKLVPLEEAHFDEINSLAKEKAIWQYSPVGVDGMDSEKLTAFLYDSIFKRNSGERYPFVIIDKPTGKIAGCTIYHTLKPENKTLEIGATWLHPIYWSAGINTECKYLLLTHCFETLGTMRVQLKANDNNPRSRKAIEKIGAKFEGILRKDKILEDGSIRNAAYYSIVDDEWPEVKLNLQRLLGNGIYDL